MFLERLRQKINKISFRLFFLYALIFITSAILLFLGAYLLLLSSLKEQDQTEIKVEAKEFQEIISKGGLELVQSRLAMAKKFERPERYFLRIADRENQTILLRLPYQWASFHIKELEMWPPADNTWKRVRGEDGQSCLEVYTTSVKGYWIQVGKTTEQRDRILRRFKETFSVLLFFLLIIGFVGGLVLSQRALKPLRELIGMLKGLDFKSLRERVPEPRPKDEVWELVVLFNGLLDRISEVVTAMKKSLDSVAHDLRTPITRMRGTAEMALCSHCTEENLRDALSDCVEESDKVLRLLDAIMDIAEAEAGALRLRPGPIEVSHMIMPLVELYTPVAEEKGVQIEVSVQPGLFVKADQVRLGQALANLLDNAVKYTKDGSTVRIVASPNEDSIEIAFEDQGPGIEEEETEKIWTWFYRSDTAKVQRGLGIGLATVKAIVEAHGGKVRAETRAEGGARFSVELPKASGK
jgi:signal transduction histidine kinase